MNINKGFGTALLFFLFQGSFIVHAQTNISGTINTYIQVTAIAAGTGNCEPGGSPTFTVSSTAGLSTTLGASGNKVLIIQMLAGSTGAINNGAGHKFASTYGAVTNYGGAGNYEFALISTIAGSNITFTNPLVNTYDVSGRVQIIPVVVYSSGVNTTGVVTGQAWNGTTGGVLLLETTTLTMNHNLDMSGRGFRGGITIDRAGACCNANAIDSPNNRHAYYFDETANGMGSNCSAGKAMNYGNHKGEGIFPLITTQQIGRGAFANAGGGGSGHNSGGGGGSNCAAGGRGGDEYGSCSQAAVDRMGGIGGYSMPNGATSVFMGGGGGAGHGNDNGATNGGNGGGIIILNVDQINVASAGLRIDARGTKPATAQSDGAGGGGGGGAILLKANTFSGSALTVTANGGQGGDNSSAGTCHAAGGGGGGGFIRTSAGLPIPGVTITAVSGGRGAQTGTPGCDPWGATDGSSCTPASGLVLNQRECITPVQWSSFAVKRTGRDFVELVWSTAMEMDNDYFEILRSVDGASWETVGMTTALNRPSSYTYTDKGLSEGIYYYRLRQVDIDGSLGYSNTITATLSINESRLIIIPSLIPQGEDFELSLIKGVVSKIMIMNTEGKEIYTNESIMENKIILSSRGWNPGIYFIMVITDQGDLLREKLVIR